MDLSFLDEPEPPDEGRRKGDLQRIRESLEDWEEGGERLERTTTTRGLELRWRFEEGIGADAGIGEGEVEGEERWKEGGDRATTSR